MSNRGPGGGERSNSASPDSFTPMSSLRVGVDLVEVERIAELLAQYGERFRGRVFTAGELSACGNRPERLAARFAAKEAVSKALGTGIGQVRWRDIEIVSGPAGRPELVLSGAAAELAAELQLRLWAVSLSHAGGQAIAFVVATG
jgi:holo-[acyl-carrier protein] synthase